MHLFVHSAIGRDGIPSRRQSANYAVIRHGNKNTSIVVFLLLLVSGVLTGVSYLSMQSALAWFCLIPLFYVLQKQDARGSCLCCTAYGIVTSAVLCYWVIPVATRYSGVLTFYSMLLYGGVVLYFSLYSALFGVGYYVLRTRSANTILCGTSVAAFYVLLEVFRMKLLPGSPWCHYPLACSQARNSIIIQWAAIGGPSLITFGIVFANYAASQFLLKREVKSLTMAAVCVLVFAGGGVVLKSAGHEIIDDRLEAVLLNDNIAAEARWNDQTGDSLAALLFRLNEEAARYDPDLFVWSETAIPWKFEPDDEFVPKALSITRRSKANHLMGMWSPSVRNSQLVYNSAYLIRSDGRIADRYDKTILLDFLERPFKGGALSVLPFFNTSRYNNVIPGRSQNLIISGKARIGMLICNESLSEEMYVHYDKANANLLVVMSNDAWFEDTPLQMHHFYFTRIGAVMIGKDVIVNSNRGIVGVIRGNGDMESVPQSDTPRVVHCVARLSSKTTLYSTVSGFTIPLYALLAGLSIVIRRK